MIILGIMGLKIVKGILDILQIYSPEILDNIYEVLLKDKSLNVKGVLSFVGILIL